jgi:hypothetical protein
MIRKRYLIYFCHLKWKFRSALALVYTLLFR